MGSVVKMIALKSLLFVLLTISSIKSEDNDLLSFIMNKSNHEGEGSFVYSIDNDETYEKITQDVSKEVLVTFYSSEDWCYYCKQWVDDELELTAKFYSTRRPDALFVKVNLDKFKPNALKDSVLGFPDLIAYKKNTNEKVYMLEIPNLMIRTYYILNDMSCFRKRITQ